MNGSDIEKIIIKIFEETRKIPGAAYVPERFLAYLTEPPAPFGRQVKDTFAGRRRFVSFMHKIQLEFGICFSNAEWERGFGIIDLCKIVELKSQNLEQQKRMAEKRVQEARSELSVKPLMVGFFISALLTCPMLLLLPIFKSNCKASSILFVFAGLLFIAVTATTTIIISRELRYSLNLVSRISTIMSEQR